MTSIKIGVRVHLTMEIKVTQGLPPQSRHYVRSVAPVEYGH
jgi:hypothetical protein